MTIEEALQELKASIIGQGFQCHPETYQKAIEALEKSVKAIPIANLAPIDKYQGLKRKYIVLKSDTGEAVENCFVLRPDKDPAARAALRAYAQATPNKTLAKDIINWVGDKEEDNGN